MSKLQDFVVTQDFKTPKVTSTGNNRQPTRIDFKYFKKGSVIKGFLHTDKSGNPDVLMIHDGTLAVPLDVIKKVVVKDIQTSGFDGPAKSDKPKVSLKPKDTKTRYLDAFVAGAIAGLILTIVSEKKGWLALNEESPYQNKLIGAAAGSVIAAFIVYRFNLHKAETKPKDKE